MSNGTIKTIFYEVKDLGKYMKGSKKKYTWIFESNGKENVVDLEYSYLSGKRKVIHNGKTLFDGTQILSAAFQYPFTIEGYVSLNIIQQGDAFELRINNQAFSHLYHQSRTKSEFVYEDDPEPKEKNEKSKNLTFDEFKTEHTSFQGFGSNPFNAYKGPSPQKETGFDTFDEAKLKKGFHTEFTNFEGFGPSKIEKEDFSNMKDIDFGKFKAPIKEPQEVAPPKEEIFENVETFNNLGSFSKSKSKTLGSTTKTSQALKSQSTNNADLLDLLDDEKPKAENLENKPETTDAKNTNVDLFSQFGQTTSSSAWDNPFNQTTTTTIAVDPFSGGFSGFNSTAPAQQSNNLAEIFSVPLVTNNQPTGPQITYTNANQGLSNKANSGVVSNTNQKPANQTKGDLWSLVDLDLKQEEKIVREEQRINNLSSVSAKPNQPFMPNMMGGVQNQSYQQPMMYPGGASGFPGGVGGFPGMVSGYGAPNTGFGAPNTGFYQTTMPGQMQYGAPQMQGFGGNQMQYGANPAFQNNMAQTPFDMFK